MIVAGIQLWKQMGNYIYDEKLKRLQKLVSSLAKEIHYKNHRLLDMELNYNDKSSTLRKIVMSLTEEIYIKDEKLFEMECNYTEASTTVSRLQEEKERMKEACVEESVMDHSSGEDMDVSESEIEEYEGNLMKD